MDNANVQNVRVVMDDSRIREFEEFVLKHPIPFYESLLAQSKKYKNLTQKQILCLAKGFPKALMWIDEDLKKSKDMSETDENLKVPIPEASQKLLKTFQIDLVKRAMKCLEKHKGHLLAWDMGSGKTYGAAAICAAYATSGYKIVVIAPKPVVKKWSDISKTFNFEISILSNYEKFLNGKCVKFEPKKKGEGIIERSIEFDFDFKTEKYLLVLDEAHRIKNPKSQISEMLTKIALNLPEHSRVLLLSGTIGESPLKMYAQGLFLGLWDTKNEYWNWALNRGVRFTGYNDSPEFRYPNEFKLAHFDIFSKGLGTRIRFSDIPGSPDQQIYIQFIDAPLKTFNQQHKAAIESAEEELTSYKTRAQNDMIQMLRERQLRELEKLHAFYNEIAYSTENERIVIFLNYSQSIDILVEHLKNQGITFGIYDGRNPNEREKIRELFQKNQLKVLVCNIQAAREGIDLHDTSEGHQYPRKAYFSPCYNAQTVAQALGRIHRVGGGFVIQTFVISEGTLEEKVWRNIALKMDCLDNLNDGESILLKELKIFETTTQQDEPSQNNNEHQTTKNTTNNHQNNKLQERKIKAMIQQID